MFYKPGTCVECDSLKLIVNRKHMLCAFHNSKRLQEGKPKKTYTIPKQTEKQKVVKQKDHEYYKQCFYYSPMRCEECDEDLSKREFSPTFVSHMLSKGAYPELRLDPRNHNILCEIHHDQWEFGTRSTMKIYKSNRIIMGQMILETHTKNRNEK